MKRGDFVSVALQGAYGKPRPALVVQSDLFALHPSVTILPVTSELREAPLFRLRIMPTPENGLQHPSDIMIDKPQTIPREKIGEVFGQLNSEQMLNVSRAMVIFLGVF